MCNAFFDDFTEVLEHTAIFACLVILMGYLNLHLDVKTDPNTVKFNAAIDNYGQQQHVALHRVLIVQAIYSTRYHSF